MRSSARRASASHNSFAPRSPPTRREWKWPNSQRRLFTSDNLPTLPPVDTNGGKGCVFALDQLARSVRGAEAPNATEGLLLDAALRCHTAAAWIADCRVPVPTLFLSTRHRWRDIREVPG